MHPDLAQHRDEDIQRVWGGTPRCPLSGYTQNLDRAHILGRGEDWGIRPNHDGRAIFSSILGYFPLYRSIHAAGFRDHRYLRALMLEIAQEKTAEAYRRGSYEPNIHDFDFFEIRRSWLLTHAPFSWLVELKEPILSVRPMLQ